MPIVTDSGLTLDDDDIPLALDDDPAPLILPSAEDLFDPLPTPRARDPHQELRDMLLASPEDVLVERLAMRDAELTEENRTLRELLSRALQQVHRFTVQNLTLQERIRELLIIQRRGLS